jgi:hypothetical protein
MRRFNTGDDYSGTAKGLKTEQFRSGEISPF